VFKWGQRKPIAGESGPTAVADAPASAVTSKVLPRLLTALSGQAAPVLLDLGPVVGPNVAFFGEKLACKIHVEDLFASIEARARRGASETELDLAGRLRYADGSVDGILCWDLFDFLPRRPAQALASRLAAMLRPGGVLYAFFGIGEAQLTHYTRFVVASGDTMRHRPYPATPTRRNVLTNRDINRMFEGLEVVESVLLKTRTRETLFRKPS